MHLPSQTHEAVASVPAAKPHQVTIGSLCTGYGGLDMAVQTVLGGRIAWCADNDRHASTILRRRFPRIPNLGDISALDWNRVQPVDMSRFHPAVIS